jgi:hypothetical protein
MIEALSFIKIEENKQLQRLNKTTTQAQAKRKDLQARS